MINSGKYKIENNQIVNIATGVAIPDDEPVFILRAKDTNSYLALDNYLQLCENGEQQKSIDALIDIFDKWQKANPDKVKEPD